VETLLTHASEIYAFFYFGVIILVSLLEWVIPRREVASALRLRWISNFGITVIDSLVLRALFPIAGLGWAIYCANRGWGLLNHISAPSWLTLAVTLLALDLATYAQHYVLHHVPLFWRMHRTHHSDLDCDFSTGVRFHPLESLYTTTILTATIAVLGLPAAAVFVSQLLTTVVTFAEHGNVFIPRSVDRVIRLFFVTPDVHRIHHSADASDTNSNYGTVFSWWDRLFGTYVAEPAEGQDHLIFGLAEFSERRYQTLSGLLAQPFADDTASRREPRAGERDPLPPDARPHASRVPCLPRPVPGTSTGTR
jgi:sterol desaturase/sphingolipid hydroxylase (fatty acid hydroxylase superfamily)